MLLLLVLPTTAASINKGITELLRGPVVDDWIDAGIEVGEQVPQDADGLKRTKQRMYVPQPLQRQKVSEPYNIICSKLSNFIF